MVKTPPKAATAKPGRAQEPPKTTTPPNPKAVDLEADSNEQPKDIKVAVSMAVGIQKLALDIANLEEKVKVMKADLTRKIQEELPALMDGMGLATFTLADGTKIEKKPYISCGIPSNSAIEKEKDDFERNLLIARRNTCFDWLRKNGGTSLIKTTVEIDFGKGDEKGAKKFVADCEKAGFVAHAETTVAPQSLQAFIKENLEAGKKIPFEPFKIFVGSVAKFTAPKKQGAK